MQNVMQHRLMSIAAKQFAAQNGFCNAATPISAPSTLRDRSSGRHILISRIHSFVPLLASNSQRTWQQCLVCPTVNIRATAIAQVDILPKPPCILALQGSVSFQGSPTVNSPTCGIASNSTASNAIDFTGNGGSTSTRQASRRVAVLRRAETNADNVITPMRHRYPIH